MERRRLIAASLFALSLGACWGSSERNEDGDVEARSCRYDDECPRGQTCLDADGNRNDVCEVDERCVCARSSDGRGGTGAGGTGAGGTGGAAGGPRSCLSDQDCPPLELCVDVDGNRDDRCDPGETCLCANLGGAGGSAGTGSGGSPTGGAGKGGSSGNGGSGGAPSSLGAPCSSSSDCVSPLVCLTSTGLPDLSGPPGGLCTLECVADDECLEHATNAYCVGFTEGVSYCIEACAGGPTTSPKCHLRRDFACNILDTSPTVAGCVSTDDCAFGQVCFEDVCQDMVTACLPTCGGDFDCGTGQFCNFATGFCVPEQPSGLPIGALCDPALPPEQDECNGFCLETDETAAEGTCAAFCSASVDLTGCGWNGTGPAEAGCLFATVVSRDAAGGISLGESDPMLCGKLCDCNADCPAAVDRCIDENAADAPASIQALFGRAGYCRPLVEGETEADSIAECP